MDTQNYTHTENPDSNARKSDGQKPLLCGEAAKLAGFSKDALRLYEEEGLLHPERNDNGFRHYHETDLIRLIAIKMYRSNDLPLRETRALLSDLPAHQRRNMIDAQMQAEKLAVLRHEENIARLQIIKQFFQFPAPADFKRSAPEELYRLSDRCSSFSETIRDYFLCTEKMPWLSTCYLHAEYDVSQTNTAPVFYLAIKQHEAGLLCAHGLSIPVMEAIPVKAGLQIYLASDYPYLTGDQLADLLKKAQKEHALTKEAHAHYLHQYESASGNEKYLLEVLLPLSES
ncbi:MAG: MerR family transcriptional regulator [Eubacteriales bacterium]|nr:MerR family transcriptional regulator [Eubacteriales bacterium]